MNRAFMAAAEIRRLTAENERLYALVMELGLHLTALCHHPVNYEKRYDTRNGAPCTGCYDAILAFEEWCLPIADKD